MKQFLSELKRTHSCGALSLQDKGKSVVLFGWVSIRRDHGGLVFIDVRDREGITQIVLDPKKSLDLKKVASEVRGEYVVAVEGVVSSRPDGMVNKKIPTGEIEVLASRFEILNRSETPPFVISKPQDVSEETRLKYRYIDLRRPALQKNIMVRHKVNHIIRNYFNAKGFLEIETPILTKSTPEGARDYLVPSRIHPGKFFALPQSPQILKQISMIAGFDKYYQVVRCFRDEDLRADRQPEFTQIDVEMSFIVPDDLFPIIEGMFVDIYKEILGINLKTPFPRLEHGESMRRFGNDKPDTRFGLELSEITDLVKGCEFKVFADATKAGIVRGLVVPGKYSLSRKELDDLAVFVKTYGAKGLAWVKIAPDGWQSPIAKFFDLKLQNKINERMRAGESDTLLFVADRFDIANDALGNLRNHLARKLNLIPDNLWNFVWVTHFPLFHYDYNEQRYVPAHHPFSSPLPEDRDKLKKDPGAVRGLTYDLALNGSELGSGSIRIHDQELQSEVFSLLKISKDEAKNKFGFLLEALSYGAPPHGGIALGIDRICMFLCGATSIRDVIAFPKTQKAVDLMSDAPSEVSQDQLSDLRIRIIPVKG
ncbi:MAG: aspartate--tRNA ligase [Deltaproteobacteria bacterium RIFCSPHIGHO2_12_FULL_43_9]|nr:MAG: aspartate--tRNA ligase [Deltaproteobacteria bacterium RIFCSPHIGHO2_12_FULL_43_9]